MAKSSREGSQVSGGFGGSYSGRTNTQPYLRQFGSAYNNLTRQMQGMGAAPQAQQFTPRNQNFNFNPYQQNTQFNPFSDKFSTLTEYGLSKGRQDIANQSNAANASLANRLAVSGGNNSALLAGLQRQNQARAMGASNALIPQALEQQRAQDVQGADIRMQQTGQAIQQGLQGDQTRLAQFGLGQQQQGLGLQAAQANNQANLASYLGGLQRFTPQTNLLGQLLQAGNLGAGSVEGSLLGSDMFSREKGKTSFK